MTGQLDLENLRDLDSSCDSSYDSTSLPQAVEFESTMYRQLVSKN